MKRLLIFAKPPIPGRVKTRLGLNPEDAARLHAAFVKDVLARHRGGPFQVSLWRGGESSHPFWSELSVPQYDQEGDDLGARMHSAISSMTEHPDDRVVLIGTDSPNLPPRIVTAAFDALEDCEVVIGPACDGGYYLIGVRGPAPELFPTHMPWGTPAVLLQTIEIMNKIKKSYRLLEFWHLDVAL